MAAPPSNVVYYTGASVNPVAENNWTYTVFTRIGSDITDTDGGEMRVIGINFIFNRLLA
jgi:hypothetical protein